MKFRCSYFLLFYFGFIKLVTSNEDIHLDLDNDIIFWPEMKSDFIPQPLAAADTTQAETPPSEPPQPEGATGSTFTPLSSDPEKENVNFYYNQEKFDLISYMVDGRKYFKIIPKNGKSVATIFKGVFQVWEKSHTEEFYYVVFADPGNEVPAMHIFIKRSDGTYRRFIYSRQEGMLFTVRSSSTAYKTKETHLVDASSQTEPVPTAEKPFAPTEARPLTPYPAKKLTLTIPEHIRERAKRRAKEARDRIQAAQSETKTETTEGTDGTEDLSKELSKVSLTVPPEEEEDGPLEGSEAGFSGEKTETQEEMDEEPSYTVEQVYGTNENEKEHKIGIKQLKLTKEEILQDEELYNQQYPGGQEDEYEGDEESEEDEAIEDDVFIDDPEENKENVEPQKEQEKDKNKEEKDEKDKDEKEKDDKPDEKEDNKEKEKDEQNKKDDDKDKKDDKGEQDKNEEPKRAFPPRKREPYVSQFNNNNIQTNPFIHFGNPEVDYIYYGKSDGNQQLEMLKHSSQDTSSVEQSESKTSKDDSGLQEDDTDEKEKKEEDKPDEDDKKDDDKHKKDKKDKDDKPDEKEDNKEKEKDEQNKKDDDKDKKDDDKKDDKGEQDKNEEPKRAFPSRKREPYVSQFNNNNIQTDPFIHFGNPEVDYIYYGKSDGNQQLEMLKHSSQDTSSVEQSESKTSKDDSGLQEDDTDEKEKKEEDKPDEDDKKDDDKHKKDKKDDDDEDKKDDDKKDDKGDDKPDEGDDGSSGQGGQGDGSAGQDDSSTGENNNDFKDTGHDKSPDDKDQSDNGDHTEEPGNQDDSSQGKQYDKDNRIGQERNEPSAYEGTSYAMGPRTLLLHDEDDLSNVNNLNPSTPGPRSRSQECVTDRQDFGNHHVKSFYFGPAKNIPRTPRPGKAVRRSKSLNSPGDLKNGNNDEIPSRRFPVMKDVTDGSGNDVVTINNFKDIQKESTIHFANHKSPKPYMSDSNPFQFDEDEVDPTEGDDDDDELDIPERSSRNQEVVIDGLNSEDEEEVEGNDGGPEPEPDYKGTFNVYDIFDPDQDDSETDSSEEEEEHTVIEMTTFTSDVNEEGEEDEQNHEEETDVDHATNGGGGHVPLYSQYLRGTGYPSRLPRLIHV